MWQKANLAALAFLAMLAAPAEAHEQFKDELRGEWVSSWGPITVDLTTFFFQRTVQDSSALATGYHVKKLSIFNDSDNVASISVLELSGQNARPTVAHNLKIPAHTGRTVYSRHGFSSVVCLDVSTLGGEGTFIVGQN